MLDLSATFFVFHLGFVTCNPYFLLESCNFCREVFNRGILYIISHVMSQETLENNRREITTVMMKSYPQLLQKYVADKAKVSSLVEIILLLKLELFSLKRQEQVCCFSFYI